MSTGTRLRLSGWSVVRAVAMAGAATVLLGVVSSSTRVIGWILVAVVLAGLFHPLVQVLDRRLPRPVALAVVLLGSIVLVGGIGAAVVEDVADEVRELQRAVPEAAEELERSERFGETARDLDLAERAETFVEELPDRLRGGDVDDAIRSAATRGVAFLATTVLTVFALVFGPDLLAAGLRQLPERRRAEVARIARSAYRRSWLYVIGSLGMALGAGIVGYACAAALDLPGAAPLALWLAFLALLPVIGVVLGSLPLLLLAWSTASGVGVAVVAVVLLLTQLVVSLRLQLLVERRSLHLGPFVVFVVAMVGLELYGVGGVFVGLVLAVVAAAVADEVLGHGPRSSDPRPEYWEAAQA